MEDVRIDYARAGSMEDCIQEDREGKDIGTELNRYTRK